MLSEANKSAFLESCTAAGITDMFLYLTIAYYNEVTQVQSLLAQLAAAGIAAWGLDGAREYFSDDIDQGPAVLYSTINALIQYNSVAVHKFIGFQTDLEPASELHGVDTFHCGVPTPELEPDQLNDRQALLSDWLAIQAHVRDLCIPAGLRTSAALPTWMHEYYDEPLMYGSAGRTLLQHMLPLIDECCLMSYNTDTDRVVERCAATIACALTMPNKCVFAGVETHNLAGDQPGVTYAHLAPPNNSRARVMADLALIEHALHTEQIELNSRFAGVCIHDYVGWSELPH
eukprot:1054-Heterococcus_DN1.PRE.1